MFGLVNIASLLEEWLVQLGLPKHVMRIGIFLL